jgi:hypothetical protein
MLQRWYNMFLIAPWSPVALMAFSFGTYGLERKKDGGLFRR